MTGPLVACLLALGMIHPRPPYPDRQPHAVVQDAPSPPRMALRGLSTWYDWRTGQAAAGPALRAALGRNWRGMTVRVCAGRCVTVRLTDWCLCGHGRVIDLDRRLFAQLAPPSRGVIAVTVR